MALVLVRVQKRIIKTNGLAFTDYSVAEIEYVYRKIAEGMNNPLSTCPTPTVLSTVDPFPQHFPDAQSPISAL
jgi:hypothetical protein